MGAAASSSEDADAEGRLALRRCARLKQVGNYCFDAVVHWRNAHNPFLLRALFRSGPVCRLRSDCGKPRMVSDCGRVRATADRLHDGRRGVERLQYETDTDDDVMPELLEDIYSANNRSDNETDAGLDGEGRASEQPPFRSVDVFRYIQLYVEKQPHRGTLHLHALLWRHCDAEQP